MDAQEVDGEWSVEKVLQVITDNCRFWRGEGMKVQYQKLQCSLVICILNNHIYTLLPFISCFNSFPPGIYSIAFYIWTRKSSWRILYSIRVAACGSQLVNCNPCFLKFLLLIKISMECWRESIRFIHYFSLHLKLENWGAPDFSDMFLFF